MTFNDVIAMERQAILAEYAVVQVLPYSAVASLQDVITTPTALRSRYPVEISALPGQKEGQAFVQLCPGLGYKFLWAHAENDNYRSDYETFLRRYHGLTFDALPSAYHVDHLFNRARARALAVPFIRMVLVPAAINISHGAGYEKSRTMGGIGVPGRQRSIDEITLMKLFGVPSPRQGMPLSAEMVSYIGRIAAASGISASEIERNIQDLLAVARFRSGS